MRGTNSSPVMEDRWTTTVRWSAAPSQDEDAFDDEDLDEEEEFEDEELALTLVPRAWPGGQGLLGCHIVPLLQ